MEPQKQGVLYVVMGTKTELVGVAVRNFEAENIRGIFRDRAKAAAFLAECQANEKRKYMKWIVKEVASDL